MNLPSLRLAAAVLAGACLVAAPLAAAELPEATKKMLAKLKMDASVLQGLDEELKMPPEWIEGAKKEGKVTYFGTFGLSEWPEFIEPFKARYPFINVDHQRNSRIARVDKPLIAYKEGRVIADIIAAIAGQMKAYKEADALMDLRVLPNFARVDEDLRGKGGLWVGEKVKYWCIAYNTKFIKKADLPRTWDDILTTKAFHNGNIGVSDRPHNWILPLWTSKGADYTRNYITRFFREVKPQLRKEGARAIVTLTIAGEFHAAIPATDYRVAEYAGKGAPISWHCPEPTPVRTSELIIVKGTKVPNAARVFMNWYLSREGQVAQYASTGGAPVHRGLQNIGFSAYPEAIKGKRVAVRSPESLDDEFTLALRAWRAAWKDAGGQVEEASAAKKVSTKLSKVLKGGRELAFGVGGGEHKVKISGSRTQIVVKGKPVRRNSLKQGMACDITYAGDGSEAKIVTCK
jgi:iron(III) transport system substrate-binding protein